MKRFITLLIVIFVLSFSVNAIAQTSEVEKGRKVHAKIINNHPSITKDHLEPCLWGALTSNPLAIIIVPIDDWAVLSDNDKNLLAAYAASLVETIKSNPFKYSDVPSTAPIANKIQTNVSRMTSTSFGIMAGRINPNGKSILFDRIVRSGENKEQ